MNRGVDDAGGDTRKAFRTSNCIEKNEICFAGASKDTNCKGEVIRTVRELQVGIVITKNISEPFVQQYGSVA